MSALADTLAALRAALEEAGTQADSIQSEHDELLSESKDAHGAMLAAVTQLQESTKAIRALIAAQSQALEAAAATARKECPDSDPDEIEHAIALMSGAVDSEAAESSLDEIEQAAEDLSGAAEWLARMWPADEAEAGVRR